MAEVDDESLKEVENKLRDLMNWVKVFQEEEEEGATQKIEDETAKQLMDKIQEISKTLGLGTL
ncbi:hypothetical protein GF336_05270 [Candidatus Woesearchaeota archaeon]|nr:hypothetical protein [Candidatus Woesearchaeota archaeon]